MTDDIPNPTTSDGMPQADPASTPAPEPGQPDAAPQSDARRSSSADVEPHRPEYKGAELDPERGPGLGCFWFQVFVLGFFIVLIPIGINLGWPYEVLAILLFVVIGLLLLTGQTVIFLLRLVAADRRAHGRRRPLASPTKTVGELEDVHRVAHAVGGEGWVEAGQPGAAPHVDPTELPREPAAAGAPAVADAAEVDLGPVGAGGASDAAAAGAAEDRVADGGSMIRDLAPADSPEMPSDAPTDAAPPAAEPRDVPTTPAEPAPAEPGDAPTEPGDAPAGPPAAGASAGGGDPEPEEPDPGVRQ